MHFSSSVAQRAAVQLRRICAHLPTPPLLGDLQAHQFRGCEKTLPIPPPCCTWMFLGWEIGGKFDCILYLFDDVAHNAPTLDKNEHTPPVADVYFELSSLWCCLTVAGRADRVQDQVYRRRWQLSLPKPCRPVRRAVAGSLRCTSEGGTQHRQSLNLSKLWRTNASAGGDCCSVLDGNAIST